MRKTQSPVEAAMLVILAETIGLNRRDNAHVGRNCDEIGQLSLA